MIIKDIFNGWNKPTKVLAVVVTVTVFFILYGVWFEARVGSIDVYVQKRGTAIYLNEKRVGTARSDNQIVKLSRISPGEHSLLLTRDGFFPWEKTIKISSGKATLAQTFLVRENINTYIKKVDFTDKEKSEINKRFNTKTSRISFGGDGNVEIKREGSQITARWLGGKESIPNFFCDSTNCNETTLVLNSDKGDIGNILFYPNRDDIVLFSVGESIFAIEIDKKNTQNFQPVYRGVSPEFAIDSTNSRLYIREGDLLLGVTL